MKQRRRLKSKLALDGLTLKEWLIKKIDQYIDESKPKPMGKKGDLKDE